MINQSNYFDLRDIYVNELVGDIWLFVFLGIILIYIASIKLKMPYQITLMMLLLWVGIVFSIYMSELMILWILAVLFVGGMFYYIISRIMNRG